jgi:transposase
VPRLEQIRDVDTLQQAALLLEKTAISQQTTIARLKAENARLRGGTVPARLELDLLKEQLEALQREIFAPSSEKRTREGDDAMANQATEPRHGHGPKDQPLLPISTVTYTLPENERTCPACHGQLEPMGGQTEDSEEITVIEASYEVVIHRRQKYRCRCNPSVVTAPGPLKLTPGGRYSPEFAVHVAEQKYLDHLPLERQARAMGRKGLDVDSQTPWDRLEALARHLTPTYEVLCRRVLASDVVFMDETHWWLMDTDGSHRWWTWCVASEDELCIYRLTRGCDDQQGHRKLADFPGVEPKPVAWADQASLTGTECLVGPLQHGGLVVRRTGKDGKRPESSAGPSSWVWFSIQRAAWGGDVLAGRVRAGGGS